MSLVRPGDIAVFGATGVVGRRICEALAGAGAAVRNGYAISTAAGSYGRFQHAVRFALRYDLQ